MSYITPDMVVSPKNKITNVDVLIDNGEDSWSLAEVVWEGRVNIGIRWNGSSKQGVDQRFNGIGNPQSRGVPTWFILPEDVGQCVKQNFIKNGGAL